MIANIFTAIGDAVTNFAGVLGNGFSSLVEIFYTTTGTNQGLTPVGLLLLIGAGIGIVYWAFAMIRSLISARRAG